MTTVDALTQTSILSHGKARINGKIYGTAIWSEGPEGVISLVKIINSITQKNTLIIILPNNITHFLTIIIKKHN